MSDMWPAKLSSIAMTCLNLSLFTNHHCQSQHPSCSSGILKPVGPTVISCLPLPDSTRPVPRQVGWFPSNYTQEEEQDDTLHLYTMAENVLDVVMALYTFQATQPQELSFQKNERLEVRPQAGCGAGKARPSCSGVWGRMVFFSCRNPSSSSRDLGRGGGGGSAPCKFTQFWPPARNKVNLA